jgi:hypothetical protein
MKWLSIAALAVRALYVLSGLRALVVHIQAVRQGRAEQKQADDGEALNIVARERDAVVTAGNAEEASRRGEF